MIRKKFYETNAHVWVMKKKDDGSIATVDAGKFAVDGKYTSATRLQSKLVKDHPEWFNPAISEVTYTEKEYELSDEDFKKYAHAVPVEADSEE